MRNILVAGAGKSSTALIQYLLSNAKRNNWSITVMDGSAEAIAQKTNNHPAAIPAPADINSAPERNALVAKADIVVSLMPPQLHVLLAKDCLDQGKNLITSSYISPEMQEMHEAARNNGLLFMCEMGLDPGIDHMSANAIIHSIGRLNGTITGFRSYCGGLVAPESDDNPWHYKISWNPLNIVNAGRDGAHYLENGKPVDIGYDHMFDPGKTIRVAGLGELAYYPNRDSLHYIKTYNTPDAADFLRATLRHPRFMEGWQALIRLGLTDNSDTIAGNWKTNREWLAGKTGYDAASNSLEAHIAGLLKESKKGVQEQLEFLGLFEETPLPAQAKTSADVLLPLLINRWELKPEDKDLVVMKHEVTYAWRGAEHQHHATMVLKGQNRDMSAMAQTVGLPMGLLAGMMLNGKIPNMPVGVCIPNMPAVYKPLLRELKKLGIDFVEENF